MAHFLEQLFSLPWSGLLIYGVLAVFSMLLSILRFNWYANLQREPSILVFSFVNLFQSIAFGGATLLLSPTRTRDYSWLVPYIRLSWLFVLAFFAVGTVLSWRSYFRAMKGRRQGLIEIETEATMAS